MTRNWPSCRWLALLFLAVATMASQPAFGDADTPSIVIDRQSGAVLVEDHPFARWYPASLTKLMTVYVTLRAMAAGELAPGSPVIISRNAANQPPSRLGLKPGTRLRFDNAIPILIIKSANDVAVAVAESVAGSVPTFVERMNAEARRLGMNDSHFANPSGLHAADNFASARDMALLARQILAEFPQYGEVFAAPAIRLGDEIDHSYNLLLGRFEGADGMKTGFVCASGYNFVASATRNGRQLIAVVLGQFSQTDRAVEAAKLLLTGFERDGGTPIDGFVRSGPPVEPVSQRGRICSESATRQRYDPGAGQAVIDSPLLRTGLPMHEPVVVALGGIDADPGDAWLAANLSLRGSIPVPAKRPQYPVETVARDLGDGILKPQRGAGAIPVPSPRPAR